MDKMQGRAYVDKLQKKIEQGISISKAEAMKLIEVPLDVLCQGADEIRDRYCGTDFDICTIINGKSGRCSEDCKFCAQSLHHTVPVAEYPLLSVREIVKEAKYNCERGVLRFSIVTSGRALSDEEVEQVCDAVIAIREEVGIDVCISPGLLELEQYKKLKEVGVTRIHNNLETSREFFNEICTTHDYEDKLNSIKAVKETGMSLCSGGIFGLGESWSDRIDMALELADLSVDSIPINFLNPVVGTPFGNKKPVEPKEAEQIVAIYRFLLPKAAIRLAGGRGLLVDKGEKCFRAGANAAISGDMLTTTGTTIETDMALVEKLGYRVAPI